MRTARTAPAAALLGLALAASAGPAIPGRPAAAPGPSFRLDTGIRVVYRFDPSSQVTVLTIGVGGGLAAEPEGKAGLTFLTSRLAMDIPDQGKAQDFVIKALHAGLDVRGDGSIISLECLSEFFDEVASTYVRILGNPLFTGVRIDGIKEYMAHQRRIETDDAGGAARLAQAEAFFPAGGCGRSIYGTEAGAEAIKAKDIKDFYDRLFVAGNLTLTVVSDLDQGRVAASLKKSFGRFRGGEAPAPTPVSPASPPAVTRIIRKEALQANVSVAFPLPAVSRRGYVLNALLENALGRGPGTRLWPLRSEKKLAYAVTASAVQMRGGGFLGAYLETDASKQDEARESLARVLEEAWRGGLSAEELAVAKAGLGTSFLRANETKLARAETLDLFESLGLAADFFEAFMAEAAAVGLEEINAHLRAVLDPAKGHWVAVGPEAPSPPRP